MIAPIENLTALAPLRIMCVFGTRPEAIKVAPIIHAAQRNPRTEPIVCSTGQHREMLDQVIEYFGIQTDLDLQLMQPGQSLTDLTSRCISGLGQAITTHQPDCILGQGDTTTAMCAAMVAFFHEIPFIHVEAGLRTADVRSPFPEEFNRRVASIATSLHCAPTEMARQNLLREHYSSDRIVVTGNTVIDALKWTAERERSNVSQWAQKHPLLANSRSVLITAHRRENHGNGIHSLCAAIAELAETFPDVQFVFPVHLSPSVQQPVNELLSGRPNVQLLAPAAYPEFVWLMDQATLILSDSGGVQEEAPSLQKPVLVTRESTERPEAMAAGATKLIGMTRRRIVAEVTMLLTDKAAYQAMQIRDNPYGDGHAAERIVQLATEHFWAPPTLRLFEHSVGV